MIYQKKTINNVPTKVPLSNSAPVGNPIGTIISTYKKIQPRNYLYCDGSTFDETLYPALYLYLGTNVLPDYRECAIVGAEKNTTDVFDSTETDPSTGLPGTQNHDVYTQGEFKDDQLQNHTHTVETRAFDNYFNQPMSGGGNVDGNRGNKTTTNPTSGRHGAVTRGKRKAVYYYIKAVDGVDISDEDTFLNTVKNYVATVMANNDVLGDEETISLSTSSSSPTIMEYDGFLIVKCESATSNQYATISINGVNSSVSKTSGGQNVVLTYPFTKGDRIYIVGQGNMGGAYKARQYKLRDYSGR